MLDALLLLAAMAGNGRIALGDWDASRSTQIFIVNPDGSDRIQLTHGPEEHWMPAWSPDGNQLAYVSRTPSGMQIHVMNDDGSNPRQLTRSGVNMAPSWSPDGTTIAYAHRMEVGFGIWLMNVAGSDATELVSGATTDNNVPTWSPDGKSIAFTSNRSGRYQIWVMNADGTNTRPLTIAYYDAVLGANIEQKVPAWSPDGRFIAYWCGVEGTDPRSKLPRDVWVMDSDGANQRRLVPGDDPAWSPDAHFILHPALANDLRLAVAAVTPDGAADHILFVTGGDFGRASWQPVTKSRRRVVIH